MCINFLSVVGVLCSLSDDTHIEIIKYSNSMFCLVCEMEWEVLATGLCVALIFCMVWCPISIATVGRCFTFF